jgi:hypothetical protein
MARIGNPGPIDLVMRIESGLRMFGQLENMAHVAKILQEGGEDRLQRRQHMLQFEYLFDRMNGYFPQLRSIILAILEPLRDESVAALGFALADCVKAAEAAIEIHGKRLDALNEQASEHGDVGQEGE